MKFSLSANSVKSAWQNNKPFIAFLFYLLLIHSVLKIIFYNYNHHLLFGETGLLPAKLKLVKWSLIYDLLSLLFINATLLLLLQVMRLWRPGIAGRVIIVLFALINTIAILLNVLDIFYFRFRFQRANADLLYVMAHPFKQVFHFNTVPIILFALVMVAVVWVVWTLHRKLYHSFLNRKYNGLLAVLLLVCITASFIFRTGFSKVLLPAYPLVEVNSHELPAVQNSFHTFAYSVFRGGDEIPKRNYMPDAACDSLFPLKKIVQAGKVPAGKKNIILFIMESVPYDFFDSNSRYKVKMPFFDSLLQKSRFYKNAFCYSHESNKGITAILAGIPTLTDIPFYHSQYVNIPVTPIGKAIYKDGYRSFFCIGDEYDNFGFAKCMNWLGIDDYYSQEDIPGYKGMPAHPMGLQDENVLPFFSGQANKIQKPFLGVHYNISTHYPYDLPATYQEKFPANYTPPMKAMQYYDHCLQQFFEKASPQPWFNETVFIFCSDHWMFPQGIEGTYDPVAGYRIPVIIFDPSVNRSEVRNEVVSQFDILGTLLATEGYKDSVISYGGNLLDSNSLKGFAFSKAGSSLYQVTDSSYVLGYNVNNDRVEYLFNYKKDSHLRNDLSENKNASVVLDALTLRVRSFIQKATLHYSGKPVK